jgi:homotetrameric cytidine deaminase/rRNA maturation RNase YbeY
MRLEWELESGLALPAPHGMSGKLQLVADCCAATEDLPAPCAVHVLLTDDARIQSVNLAQRGVDHATDVLSFPTVAYAKGKTARTSLWALRREYDADLRACFLGDVLISLPHALSQAHEYGHNLMRELCYLLAHGIFHLCGYDHAVPTDQKEMRTMEEKALRMAGETRGDSPASPPDDGQLLALAREAMQRSYSPYSRFRVGACVLCEDGRVYTGCNVENASFGLTNCAERTAIFKAVSEGATGFNAIAIAAEGAAPWPCGACRQVLNEFAPDIRVLVTWGEGQTGEMRLSQLLPHGFGPKDLP